ncbi:hypothetical protein [Dysgonomonas sp. 520]|uniref:hypothetical protein n=1 Tax=Dysgonomonas sp. 520 TaxID=2302931 RepID=UPI0013CFC8BA|nr:hypothetical protein [Dysgonomonas sp. 520]NDW11184.1 hypothetical protein [Dysgonomonas sp. 520]
MSTTDIDKSLLDYIKGLNTELDKLAQKQLTAITVTGLFEKAQDSLMKKMNMSKIAASGLVYGGLYLLTQAISGIIKKYEEWKHLEDELRQTSQYLQEQIATEKVEYERLFSILRNAEKGSIQYQKAKDSIISKYGVYLKGLSQEIISLQDVEGAYKAISKAALQSARDRTIAVSQEKINNKYIEVWSKNAPELKETLRKKGFSEDNINKYMNDLFNGIESQNADPLWTKMRSALWKQDIDNLWDTPFKDIQNARVDLDKSMTQLYDLFKTPEGGEFYQEPLAVENIRKNIEEAERMSDKTYEERVIKNQKLARLRTQLNEYLTDGLSNTSSSLSEYKVSLEDALKIEDKAIVEMLHFEAEVEKKKIDNQEYSYEERLTSLTKFHALQAQYIGEDRKLQLAEHERNNRQKGESEKDYRTRLAIQIMLIEEKSNQQLLDLDKECDEKANQVWEEFERKRIEKYKTNIENELAIIKKGSDEELALKIKQLKEQERLEIESAEKIGTDISIIKEKYRQQEAKLKEDQQTYLDSQRKIEWENQVMQTQLDGENTLALKIAQKATEIECLRQLEEETDTEYLNRKLNLQMQLDELEEQSKTKRLENQQKVFDGLKAVGAGFEDFFNAWAEQSSTMAGFGKAMALFNIAIASAEAIANATKSAKGMTAFDYIAQVGAAVGVVLSNIAKAKKIISSEKEPKAPKSSSSNSKNSYALGGLVLGEGSGTSDSISAWLSNGESVLTARATSMFSPVLSAFNQLGGGMPIPSGNISAQIMGEDMLAQAFKKAITEMPNPVVSVEEINNTNKRIQVLERYRSL